MKKDTTKAWDEHALLIGRISVAANTVQYFVFNLFWLVCQIDIELARAIFFSVKSDAGQRDMTFAAAKSRLILTEEETLLTRIGKMLDQAGKLAGERNAFIHTMWMMQGSDKQMNPSPYSVPHPKLQTHRIKSQADELHKKLSSLVMPMAVLTTDVSRSPSIEKLREQRTKGQT